MYAEYVAARRQRVFYGYERNPSSDDEGGTEIIIIYYRAAAATGDVCLGECVCVIQYVHTTVQCVHENVGFFSCAEIRAQSMKKTSIFRHGDRALSRYKIYLRTVNTYNAYRYTHTRRRMK